jgi:Tfp pilus assembly protein PilO
VIGTLSRPLPKKQISRLLIVNLAVIVVLLAVPINSNYRDLKLAREAMQDQQRNQTVFNASLRTARDAELRIPGTLGEIRAARDILASHTRRLRHVAESAAIQEQVRDLVGRRQLNFMALRAQAATPYEGFEVQPMTLGVEGSFNRLLGLLHELRNLDTMIQIGRIQLQRAPSVAGGGGGLQMSAELRTVLMEEEASLDEITSILSDTTWIGFETDAVIPDSVAAPPDTGGIGR